MADNEILKDIVEDEEAYVPLAEKHPINISDEAEKSEKELEKIAPVDDTKVLKTKSASKRALLVILFVAVNLIAILLTVVMEFGGETQPVPLSSVWNTFMDNWYWGVLAIMMFAGSILAESALRFILLRTTLKRNLPLISINSTIVCKYYDNITPLGSGGQPFEVYYLRKKGIPIGIASGVPIVTYALGRMAYVFVSILTICIHGFGQTSTFIKVLCLIGLTINLAIPFSIFCFTILPKFATSVASFVAKIAAGLHIVKDKDAFQDKIVSSMTEYADCLRYFLKKSKINMCIGFLCSMGYFFALYSIPYFTIRMCGNSNVHWFETFALCIICYAAIALLPTPGNAGGAELSFRSIFATFLEGGVLVWGIISWRIFSYYLFIIVGIIAIIIQQIYKLTKSEKIEKVSFEQVMKRQLPKAKKHNKKDENLYTPIPNGLDIPPSFDINSEMVMESETIIQGSNGEESNNEVVTIDNAQEIAQFTAVIEAGNEITISEESFKDKSAQNDEISNIIIPVNSDNNEKKKKGKRHKKYKKLKTNDANIITPANSENDEGVHIVKEIPHQNEDERESNVIKPLNSDNDDGTKSGKEIPLDVTDENQDNIIKPLNSDDNK